MVRAKIIKINQFLRNYLKTAFFWNTV